MECQNVKIEGEWHSSPGASPEALAALRAVAPAALPEAYFQLLGDSDGGEGPLPDSPFYFILDSAEVAGDPRQIALYQEQAPLMFVFGGNGAGELVAFDLRNKSAAPWPIVSFDAIDPQDSVIRIAESFVAFVSLIGKQA